MKTPTPGRRAWITSLCVLATLLCAARPLAQEGIQLGAQTWTMRNLNFDQMVAFAVKHGIKHLALSVQFDPLAPREEIVRQREVLEKHGLHAYTFGVAQTSLDKEKNRKLFEAARLMGMKQIIVEPQDFKIFDQLEELVREYDIRIAVHNHGIRSLYGNPAVLRNLLQHRDPRMGVCLDTGWVTAAGFDAAAVFRDYQGRVFDIHLKDKKVTAAVGEDVATDTHIGEGNANLEGLFTELKKARWSGVMAVETDSPLFAAQPGEFVDKARAYFEAHSR